MNIEMKLQELELIANRLETALSEKDKATEQLKTENMKLKHEIGILRDVIYLNSKNTSRHTAKRDIESFESAKAETDEILGVKRKTQ